MTSIGQSLNNFELSMGLVAAHDFPTFNIQKGETLSSYLVKFLARKLEKTGWNGGRIEMVTIQKKGTKGPDGETIPGEELETGFPALLDALQAGGFCLGLQDAMEKIQLLGTVLKASCPVAYRVEEVTRKSPRDGQETTYQTLQVWLKGVTPRRNADRPNQKPIAW